MKYLRKKRILPWLAVFKLKVALQNHEECCETCRVWCNHRTPINSIRERLPLDAVKSYYLKHLSSMFTISKQWKWYANIQCLLSGVDIIWEFLTWDLEKCSLSVLTSVHIILGRLVLQKRYELLSRCLWSGAQLYNVLSYICTCKFFFFCGL